VITAIQINEWDYFALPLDIVTVVGSVPQAFGETLVFASLPVLLVSRHTHHVTYILLAMVLPSILFVTWHEHVDDKTLLFASELIICLTFLRMSEWGARPFAGLMLAGTVHWTANLVVVAVANIFN